MTEVAALGLVALAVACVFAQWRARHADHGLPSEAEIAEEISRMEAEDPALYCLQCSQDVRALRRAEPGSVVMLTCKRHHEAANVTSLRDMVERTRVRT